MSLLVCQSSHRMKENISDRHREGSASGTGVKEKYNTEYSFFLLLFVTSELIIWNIIAIHSICEGLLIHIVLKTIHERSRYENKLIYFCFFYFFSVKTDAEMVFACFLHIKR